MRLRLFLSLALVIAGFCTISVKAQQYNFKTYTSKNGLGSSIVNCIYQDSRGDIWFGTQSGGVSRFNGANFRTYTKLDGLVGNDITCVTEDRNGNIWVGTSEGASRFNGIGFTNFTDSTGLKVEKGIYSIYVDAENIVWFGSRGGGLQRFDGTAFQTFTGENGLPSNGVYSISQTKDGTLWFACYKGIGSYDGKEFTTWEQTKGKTFFATMVDNQGDVWFGGTPGNGVLKHEGGQLTAIDLPEEVKDDFIGSLTEDRQGRIWFATDHGVLKLANGEFQLFTQDMGLPVNGVLSVASDQEGNAWIGTQGAGVSLLFNEAFVTYSEKQGLAQPSVSAITVDDEAGKTYVGTTRGGIFELEDGFSKKFQKANSNFELDELSIYRLQFDDRKRLWVGAQEGLFILNPSKDGFKLERKIDQINGEKFAAVNGVIQLAANEFYVSSYGDGLLHMDGDSITLLNTQNGFASDNLLGLYQDKDSNIWIATQDAGVMKFDGSSFQSLSSLVEFPDPWVWAITQDDRGIMYFGTSEKGLLTYDGNRLRSYNMRSGTNADRVKSVHWDRPGQCLWVGTSEGMNKLKFDVDGNIYQMKTYSEKDGLASSEIDQNAIAIDQKGNVWFGSTNGITVYRPKYDNTLSVIPKIRLESIRLDREQVDWRNYVDSVDPFSGIPLNLILNHRRNNLTFDVRAMTTDKAYYSFKLEGQEEHWSPYTALNEAHYSNINPGTYTLLVKARTSNRVEVESEFAYTFTILPPWWSLWYVKVGFGLLLIALVVVIIKGRERVLVEQNKLLEATVKERTAEVVKEKKEVEKLYNRSEELLLNILPAETAEELKAKGEVDAKLIEEATVLFTDFKGFTAMSEKLAPKDLVRDIHECFSEFDRIMAKYGVEKIKTIGDAYMAAGGLPVPNKDHASNVIKAALEMVAFVEKGKALKEAQGLPFFEIRVGVHTGPVVAGIVGIKKFQYDIWGDTVNTASRMESSGEAGKVNISQTTYALVKDEFNCIHRGKVAAKGKGEIDMYFVEGPKKA